MSSSLEGGRTPDDLERLLDLWEEARDRGEPVSPEELCRDRPDLLQEFARIVAELAAADAFLRDDETINDSRDGGSADQGSTDGPRYRDERFLAEGGLGRVYVARDSELPRDVALKRLKDGQARNAQGRRRFVLEAEITARLEHPGVVPVYGLGRGADGQPYYAMRLIRGETMATAIERFHAQDEPGRDPGERQLALQGLLRAFLAACQTIAYAHSRGVIHRDLKPANLMLGPYGEALVVDWGLAKVLGAPEAEGETWPGKLGAWDETSAGTIKGSPSYMSPEQAEGRVERIGPPSDVYSLGATLYTLLTGALPFAGKTAQVVLVAVRSGRFEAPRKVKPGVPRPLEAICLRAMRLDPVERYPGAGDLAADVERWLSGEPVSAWAEPWYDRLRRWGRRHRVVVASGLAAALVGVAVLALTNGRLRDLANRLDVSNVALRGALDDAERNLYARDVDLADRAWWDGQPSRSAELLDECPKSRRGWEWRYLARRNRPGLASSPIAGPLEALGVRDDGRGLAVDARTASILVREVTGPARLAAVGVDGDKIALVLAGRPGEVALADALGRKPIEWIKPGAPGMVEGLAFAPDGRSIAMIVVRREWPPPGSKEKISFATEFEARLVVRSLETGREDVSDSFSSSGMIGTPVLARGGRCFCPVTFGASAALFATRPGSPEVERVWSGGGGLVVVSPDGFRFAGRGDDRSEVVVREVADGHVVATLRGHAGPVRALAFGPEGRRLVTSSDDRTARVWDVALGRCSAVLRGQVHPADRLAFSPDGSKLATASVAEVVVWDPSTTSEARVAFEVERPHLDDLAAARGGRVAVLAGHRLAWRDSATGRAIGSAVEIADAQALASPADGSRTAVGIGDGSIILLDGEGRPVGTWKGHQGPIAGLSFDQRGIRLASASREGEVRVWEVSSGRELARLEAGSVVALGPDGATVAVAGERGLIVADSMSGMRRRKLTANGSMVRRLAFSPDGRLLAAISDELAVYEVESGRSLYSKGDQPSGVSDAAFCPDGTRLASADRSGEVVIRESAGGKPLLTLRGPAYPIRRIAFTPDGNRLLAAGGRVDPLGLLGEEAEEFTVWDARPPD